MAIKALKSKVMEKGRGEAGLGVNGDWPFY
jgi:hypothetical protein